MSAVSRHNNLDLLRLLAATMVVALHVVDLSAERSLAFLHALDARLALSTFFVLSGYLVVMSCERSPSLAEYARRRARRILPAYAAVVIACACLGVCLSTLSAKDYFTSPGLWRYVVANLTFLNFIQPSLPGVFTDNPYPGAPVNGALWTIKVEVMFYMIVPVLVALCRRFGHRPVLSLTFLFGCLWWGGFMALAWHTGKAAWAEVAKQMPGQLMFFAPGAFAWYERQHLARLRHQAGLLGVALLVLACQSDPSRPSVGVFLYPLALTLVVFWLAFVVKPLGNVTRWGDLSYGIYIVHFPVIQTLVAVGLYRTAPAAGLIVSVALTAMLAWASWRWIEAPALQRGRDRSSPPAAFVGG